MQVNPVRLLAAPVAEPPETAVARALAGLPQADRATVRSVTPSATHARPVARTGNDDYVWTASAGATAASLLRRCRRAARGQQKAASQWDGQLTSTRVATRALREAAIQYAMQVNFTGGAMAGTGRLVNLYA